MELRQLRYFVTLAEELHFRRAAERMHIAQPAFSEQIRRLERELGAQLFDRTSHYVRLTEAGGLFLGEVQRALAQVDHAAEVAARAARGELGSLTVGFIGSAANELTPQILRRFNARHPGVGVSLREFGYSDPSAGLAEGEVDVAFVRPPVECEDALVFEPLLDESCVAAVASDHPLAREQALSAHQLRAEALVQANTVDECLQMVASGAGVALTPASTERFHGRPGVRFLPVTDVAGSCVGVAYRKDAVNPAAEAFAGVARECAVPLAAIA